MTSAAGVVVGVCSGLGGPGSGTSGGSVNDTLVGGVGDTSVVGVDDGLVGWSRIMGELHPVVGLPWTVGSLVLSVRQQVE